MSATVKKTKGWVLKFDYERLDPCYAGKGNTFLPFTGVPLENALVFPAEKTANYAMLSAYASRYNPIFAYPHPVPVTITETTTPGELRETGFSDAEVDGYVIREVGATYIQQVSAENFMYGLSLAEAQIFPTKCAAAVAIYERNQRHSAWDKRTRFTIVPVTCTSPTTTRTVEEVPAWTDN